MENNNPVIVFGATSALAQSTIRKYRNKQNTLWLVARDEKKLQSVVADATARGIKIGGTFIADLGAPQELGALGQTLCQKFDSTATWYFFQGILPEQKEAEKNWSATEQAFNVNFTGIARLLHEIASHVEEHQGGTIVVVSSVAGLRGRQSNYIYGTGKGALNIYLEGLRNRLAAVNGSVVTILPGFIITPMTDGLTRDGFLWASADRVANDIYKAATGNRNVCYSPWFWRPIMWVIRSIPEFIFKRLSL